MNKLNNALRALTATEWSKLYVQEWLREGETELWAGQSSRYPGKPIVAVVHCAAFDGEPPCIEVRIGKRVAKSVMATRNWQNERRAMVKFGMELAGLKPSAGEVEAALDAVRAKQPSVSDQVAELAKHIADRLAYENGSWELLECVETAKAMAWTVTAGGPQALRAALDTERSATNQRHQEFEQEGRETVAI
ncbi:hypothetical protein SE17_07465, partial [Kouleothrix aurantiaca]